jgi:DNA mismatch endonuclease, patch repair protein
VADIFSAKKRSEIMSNVKARGNRATELRLIAFFRKYELAGWRRGMALFGSPDFVFPKRRVVVFVDGCFWHGCAKHGTLPASNAAFWRRKLRRNKTRDRAVNQILTDSGWRVLRIWQHELTIANESRLLRRIKSAIARPVLRDPLKSVRARPRSSNKDIGP